MQSQHGLIFNFYKQKLMFLVIVGFLFSKRKKYYISYITTNFVNVGKCEKSEKIQHLA